MICEYTLSAQRDDFYNITPQVREAVAKSGITSGIAVVYCPHTKHREDTRAREARLLRRKSAERAGITINENADPGCLGEQDAKCRPVPRSRKFYVKVV